MGRKSFFAAVAVLALGAGVTACDVEQTREGEFPEVEIEGGRAPEYDVDTRDVDIDWDTARVIVPDVDVRPDDEGEQERPERGPDGL